MGILNMVYGGWQSYKTYTELKAMTQADVLTELNTDAQWYYDNLNGNGHIIWIWIANNDNTSYQCWDVSPIIYWNWAWRNGEIIIVKIKADSNGDLKIPKAWYWTSWSQNASYNWWVSYDGWNETQYSGTWSAGSITIASGLTADTEHTIIIRPNSESYGWARAFWFRNSWVQTYLTEIVYDCSYKWYCGSSTQTGNYARYNQYRWCTNLILPALEVMPNSVTSIWNDFRRRQYRECSNLTTCAEEVMSNSVTSIWNDFRNAMYQYTNLTTPALEVMPNSVTSIWGNFRNYQYSDCSNLTTPAEEVMPDSITSIWDYFRGSMYYWCAITTPAEEVMPDSVTSIWSYFRNAQYSFCSSITSSSKEVIPNSVTSIWGNFRNSQYRKCTSLLEIKWWKDLSIWGASYRYNMYDWCTSMKTVKVIWDIWYASSNTALLNDYVSVVLVPSAYLQNYKDATTYPRSSITDSKFVWY